MASPAVSRMHWIFEPFEDRADCLLKKMFGSDCVYFRGRLVLAVATKTDPWDGLLCPTSRTHHASLRSEYPSLRPHAVLGKWLYLPASADDFEQTALDIVEVILAGDIRFGVEPVQRKRRPKRHQKNPT
jgi:hypothetical protein